MFLVLAVAPVLLVHIIIRREERFQANQFGDAFRDYSRRVRRYGL